MLWLLEKSERQAVLHCDLCCEQTYLPLYWGRRNNPVSFIADISQKNLLAREPDEGLDWRWCGCEKGWTFKYLPHWDRARPKYDRLNLVWCARCGAYVAGGFWALNESRFRRKRLRTCDNCDEELKLLAECEGGIFELKRALADAR